MLAIVSSLENDSFRDGREGEMVEFSIGDDCLDFSNDNFLESINFDDLFIEMDDGKIILPDLEIDSEVFPTEILLSGEDSSEFNYNSMTSSDDQKAEKIRSTKDEVVSKRDGGETVAINSNLLRKETVKARKSSSLDKSKISSHGKRKVKVDWTAELHRRFVEAVEQLGVEKAVPSKILEIMGTHRLTRHNIASHLQKYRSHRKHLLARESEAANWSQRRQMCGVGTTTTTTGGGRSKREIGPWLAPPTMGFPPSPHFRPLHVWGHPSLDRPQLPPMWPNHIAPSPSPPHLWPPSPSPHQPTPSIWYPHHNHHHHQQRLIPPPYAMYKVNSGIGVPPPAARKSCPQPPVDFHPSKESIDAAIEDILSKPWQPLPLGLKAPAVDSVMVELQRQGIQKIPPPTCV